MKDRTEKRVKSDAEYIMELTAQHNDLKLMLRLIEQELYRRGNANP